MEKINKDLIEKVSEERHVMKVVEECMELGEVLVKYINKAPEYKPPVEKIIEEMGDLKYRMDVLAMRWKIENEVDKSYQTKLEQINEWYLTKNSKVQCEECSIFVKTI